MAGEVAAQVLRYHDVRNTVVVEILQRNAVYVGVRASKRGSEKLAGMGRVGQEDDKATSHVSSLAVVLPLYDGAQRTTRSGMPPSPFMSAALRLTTS